MREVKSEASVCPSYCSCIQVWWTQTLCHVDSWYSVWGPDDPDTPVVMQLLVGAICMSALTGNCDLMKHKFSEFNETQVFWSFADSRTSVLLCFVYCFPEHHSCRRMSGQVQGFCASVVSAAGARSRLCIVLCLYTCFSLSKMPCTLICFLLQEWCWFYVHKFVFPLNKTVTKTVTL